MKILALVAQRKESYPGEFAPEVLAAIDDVCDSDDSDYMAGELRDAKADGSLESFAALTIEIDDAKVAELLRPRAAEMVGKLV